MLNAWSVLALVLSVGFAFLFFYVVKLVMQLINTVKTLEDTVKNIEKNITPIIENFDGITGKVEDITNRADLIIGVVEAKTEETTQIIQKARVNLDIIRHSLYIFVIQIFKYFKILSKDVNVSKNESVDSDTKKNDTNSSKVRIVDHLEKVKYN